jgi:acetoacetate decarboxylase
VSRLRYVKTPEQVALAREANPEFLKSRVRSIRCVYETDPAIAAALVPRPLEMARPEIHVTFSEVRIELGPEAHFEIGSGVFGVAARHEGVDGIYLVTMPMTTEQAVVPGRETYGEPKKLAAVDFRVQDGHVEASVTRMGVAYLGARGRLGASLGPREFVEHGFCFKALPACEKGRDFDGDPLLVRLDWRHQHDAVHRIDGGELVLRESPFDPVADVPVRRLVRMEYEEGTTASDGRVLRSVPGAWLLPFLHQRYDDPAAVGIEV